MDNVVALRGRAEPRVRNLVLVAGTRPEAIKLAPLLLEARTRPALSCTLIATGQHGALFDDALAAFGLAADRVMGSAASGLTIEALEQRVRHELPWMLDELAADWVIVQGDTTSAHAAAITARRHGIRIAHVEAGLRSGNPLLPWPEERNRTEIDQVADLLFAPGEAAAENLRAEGIGGEILVTGNSGIDALFHVRDRIAALPLVAEERHPTIFITCHRREITAVALEQICAALRQLAANRVDLSITVALPGDPAKAGRLRQQLGSVPAIRLEAPLDYPDAVGRLLSSTLVLSDSGGLQEECAALGVPMLVLRENSERPEVVAAGNARLVGHDTELIVAEAIRLLDDTEAYRAMSVPSFPYGRGDAAAKMLDALERHPLPHR